MTHELIAATTGRWRRAFSLGAPLLVAAALAGCGGGDGDGGFGAGFGDQPTPGGSGSGDSGNGQPPGGESGPAPDVSTDPASARLEVEGEVLLWGGNSIIYYTCDTTDGAQVNIQTPEGQDILLQYRGGFGSITARDDESDVYYAASIENGENIWIEGNTVIFSGEMERQQASDRLDAEPVDGTLVINCDPPGGEHARAEIDGTTHEFPASGTQSYECLLPDEIRVDIQPQLEGAWLQIDVREEGAITLGSVSVRLTDSTYFSQIPDDGEGLEIDGKSLTYTGVFEQQNRTDRTVIAEDIEGTVTVTCP